MASCTFQEQQVKLGPRGGVTGGDRGDGGEGGDGGGRWPAALSLFKSCHQREVS